MKYFKNCILGMFLIYSLFLIYIEVRYSQQVVRNFFSDIQGPLPLFAINTSFCFFLLGATALLFWVALHTTARDAVWERRFYWSQIVVFTYLALDDRFLFHEAIGNFFDIEDAFILLIIGLAEIWFLLKLGQFRNQPTYLKNQIYIVAFLFGCMIVIDGFFPSQLVLRLTAEDLSKLWADIFLFRYAWGTCIRKIEMLKNPLMS